MSALTRRETRGLFPNLVDWPESPLSVLRPFVSQLLRMEDYIQDGRYVVRAELPGIDPDYGVFSRHVQLPAGADEDDDIKATYHNGILEITVGLKGKEQVAGRQIQVKPAWQAEQES